MSRSSPFASLPRFRQGSFGLFVVVAIASALLSDQPVARHLVLLPGDVIRGVDVWTPLTANFIYPQRADGGLILLVGTLVIQWFIGSELESFWGTRKYLLLVLGAGVAGHLVSVALAVAIPAVERTPVGGMTAVDMAAVTAFGLVFAGRPLRVFAALPLSARGLAALIVGLTVLGPLARGAPWPVVVPWLVAVTVAALATTRPWRRLWDSGKLSRPKRPTKRHLRVVRPDPKLLN